MLGLPDGGCAEVPPADVVPRLVESLQRLRPTHLVTFGPDGLTGHSDHATISRGATAAWEAAGRRERLLYVATPAWFLERFADLHRRFDNLVPPRRRGRARRRRGPAGAADPRRAAPRAEGARRTREPGPARHLRRRARGRCRRAGVWRPPAHAARDRDGGGTGPTVGDSACVRAALPAAELGGGGTERFARTFDRVLAAAAPDLAEQVRPRIAGARPRGWVGRPGSARRCPGPGWALVGDAASFTNPIGAHGMTDAFVAAELLCSTLDRHDRVDDALPEYRARRREIAWPLMPLVERVASFDWDLADLQRTHLALNEAMRAAWDAVLALGTPCVMMAR